MKNLLEFKDGSYPMLCRVKKTQKSFDKDTNMILGTIEIEVSDLEPCSVGDEFFHQKAQIVVTEVLESRPARGKHASPAIWNKIIGDYTEVYAGTN